MGGEVKWGGYKVDEEGISNGEWCSEDEEEEDDDEGGARRNDAASRLD